MTASLEVPEKMQENLASPNKETIRGFFNDIASCYDQINSLLSLNLDEYWRRRAVSLVLERGVGEKNILDLGVGTGKFLKRFLPERSWKIAAGVDFSSGMLQQAEKKLPAQCGLIQADVHDLPFADESFDLIISSFTLRSVKDRNRFFRDVRRILKPAGKIAFLCLTRPRSLLGRALYTPYLKFYLPFMGGLISRDPKAYRFLSESIQSFPSPSEIAKELKFVGFKEVLIFPFTFGISTLIRAEK